MTRMMVFFISMCFSVQCLSMTTEQAYNCPQPSVVKTQELTKIFTDLETELTGPQFTLLQSILTNGELFLAESSTSCSDLYSNMKVYIKGVVDGMIGASPQP
ncbi:MAG: hypothetical protein ACRBBP_05465 [Bdellovibrionales bacterium]